MKWILVRGICIFDNDERKDIWKGGKEVAHLTCMEGPLVLHWHGAISSGRGHLSWARARARPATSITRESLMVVTCLVTRSAVTQLFLWYYQAAAAFVLFLSAEFVHFLKGGKFQVIY